jgi:hypothetical protein
MEAQNRKLAQQQQAAGAKDRGGELVQRVAADSSPMNGPMASMVASGNSSRSRRYLVLARPADKSPELDNVIL